MIHSFLLIGQSNMAGRGYFDEAHEIDTTHIKVLRNGRWQQMYRPVNGDRPFSGVCLAESFAEKYAGKYGVEVGLIPCADGGTSLAQWKPGSLLFDHAVCQARLASRTSTIAGVLWHQGEADCKGNLQEGYKERLEVIIKALRKELELYDVPFVTGGLGDFLVNYNPPIRNHHLINKQLKLLAEKDPLIGFASAEGLGSNPDNLHFSADSLYEFGLRYFDEYERKRDPKKVYSEKPCEDDALRTEMELL